MAKGKGSKRIQSWKTGRRGRARSDAAMQNPGGKGSQKVKRDKLEATIVYSDGGVRVEGKADLATGIFDGPPKATLANKLNDNRPAHNIRRKNDKRISWEVAKG